MPLYHANIGPMYGPYRLRDAPGTIDVLDARTGELIGVARRLEEAPAGVAMWRLVLGDVEIEGRWNVVGRDFCRYDAPPSVFGPSAKSKP